VALVALRRPKVCIYEKTNNAVVLHAYSCEIILKTSFKPLVLLLAGAEKRVTDDEKLPTSFPMADTRPGLSDSRSILATPNPQI